MKNRLMALVTALALCCCGFSFAEEAVSADAPRLLEKASWIWSEDTQNNVWVDFVRVFSLEEVPETALAEIGAENKYWLYVNGTEAVFDGGLKRGPNPTDGYFDTVDLAPYLRAGDNVLCLRVWFWGIKGEAAESYSNVPLDTAGLIFAADLGGELLVSDTSWQAQRAEAFLDDTTLGVPQPNYRFPEYNVYYDAAAENHAGWTDPGYDYSAWPAAVVRGAYGDAPWNALHQRPIPLIRVSGEQAYLNSAEVIDVTSAGDETLVMKLPVNSQVTPGLTVVSDRAPSSPSPQRTPKAPRASPPPL